MIVTLKCDACLEKFRWEYTEITGWPNACPCCGASTALPEGDVITLPAIRTKGNTANNDQLYRDIEKGSEHRAEVAADMLGVPVSEMSDMKVTNLNDRRDTEVAAVELPPSPVTQRMVEMQARGIPSGWQAAGSGVAASPQIQGGFYPNAGAHFQKAVRERHARMTNFTATPDNLVPTEVTNPNYHVRVPR
jgi:hypothetical protein